MSFDWNLYLNLAETLRSHVSSQPEQEARYRSAASRAYYAAFHAALIVSEKTGFSRSHTGRDHFDVRTHLRNAAGADKRRRKAVTELQRLYDLRQKADYDDTLDRQPCSLAEHAVSMARRIVEVLDPSDSS